MYDNVERPKHYNEGRTFEVIDYIRESLGSEGFEKYCIGNVIKYISRYELKNGKEDLKKALTYLEWSIKEIEKREF